MKLSVVERSSLEDSFWKGLQEIAQRHEETLSDRQFANLSSAIRLLSGSELDLIHRRQTRARNSRVRSAPKHHAIHLRALAST
jgi:predicted DNA-binding ribbon-helix-helix protein